MSIFRASRNRNSIGSHGTRISADSAGYFDFESEVLQNDEYAWSWGMAKAFKEAFEGKFDRRIQLCAKYETGLLGSCHHYNAENHRVVLRPTLRGSEAWRTLFHELAHALTPPTVADSHGKEWMANLVVVHDFWTAFLKSVDGDLKTRLIEMVTNYAYWKGRPIGMDEDTDPWNRPWAKR